jgi:Icc-related predicted phosphoesterase
MKIYAVADIHANQKKLALIERVIRHHRPNLLIVAGDIINYFSPRSTLEKLDGLEAPVYYVRGNADPPRLDRLANEYPNLINLHLQRVAIEGVCMVGVSGTLPLPFHTKFGLFEKKILDALTGLVSGDTCLIAHPPPYGACDRVMGRFHAGSRGLAALIETVRPPLVICGHIHEDAGIVSFGNTTVVNCSLGGSGKGALVDMDKKGRVAGIRLIEKTEH